MPPAIWLVAALIGSSAADSGAARQAPSYSVASIVNAASYRTNSYGPNTFVSIYGQNLAWVERGLSADDVAGGRLPTVLPKTGVRVWIGAYPAHIYYVSPGQINVLIPADLRAGRTELRVQLDSPYGPAVPITLTKAAPALFQLDAQTAIAARADGTVATAESPAKPGEVVVLYATGLGETSPALEFAEIPRKAAPLLDLSAFQILVEGKQLDPARVYYAGVAPGFGGLYQINIQLPDDLGPDPEIRIVASGVLSPAGIRIPLRP
jgi:uncharacterized protein (TIGR03437 family)